MQHPDFFRTVAAFAHHGTHHAASRAADPHHLHALAHDASATFFTSGISSQAAWVVVGLVIALGYAIRTTLRGRGSNS